MHIPIYCICKRVDSVLVRHMRNVPHDTVWISARDGTISYSNECTMDVRHIAYMGPWYSFALQITRRRASCRMWEYMRAMRLYNACVWCVSMCLRGYNETRSVYQLCQLNRARRTSMCRVRTIYIHVGCVCVCFVSARAHQSNAGWRITRHVMHQYGFAPRMNNGNEICVCVCICVFAVALCGIVCSALYVGVTGFNKLFLPCFLFACLPLTFVCWKLVCLTQ